MQYDEKIYLGVSPHFSVVAIGELEQVNLSRQDATLDYCKSFTFYRGEKAQATLMDDLLL